MQDIFSNIAAVETVLADFKDPETGRSAMEMEQIANVEVHDGELSLTLALSSHSAPIADDVCNDLEAEIRRRLPQLSNVTINRAVHERPPQKLGEIGLMAKSVIAVGSGKGGVGKSTIATSLALALQRFGCKVGLMDADVYGPSVPHLLGLTGKPEAVENKLVPIDKDGLAVMSMAFFVPTNDAVVWRGPMLHGAVTQFLRDVHWGELDYLIIDMPPGTGDIALTLSQLLPLTGAVVVCTPQHVALLDAVKAMAMFQKVNIPLLGMVENMSGFVCPECDKRYDIFGSGGAKRCAEELNVPVLGEVPIHIQIRSNGDDGRTDANFDDTTTAPYFKKIAHNLSSQLAASAATAPPQPSLPVLG
ncbi:MAG: Mrp/NBP35 family ATP-binding protein [Pirellulales bacterium]|nr:Mrp/NBP35 family ATP-binding protein [Pirellulales bacterium]